MTQHQLAEQLNVDQGTVSRWERGVESPRPSRQGKLRAILLRERDRRAMQRGRAFVAQDVRPSTLLDSQLRLVAISRSARKHFASRGKDPDALIGMSLEQFSDRYGVTIILKHLISSGFLSGDCIFFRFIQNSLGRGHVTVYEPILEDGVLVGVLNFLTHYFDFANKDHKGIELIEIVRFDDPSRAHVLHRGPNAEEAIKALRVSD